MLYFAKKLIATGSRRAVLLSILVGGSAGFTPLPALALQSVTLAWDASPDMGVTGYFVYCGPASGVYTKKVPVGPATSVTLFDLAEGATCYFAVTAHDSSGLESIPSNEVVYSVPPGVVLATQISQTNGLTVISITATGTLPPTWVVETSRDLRSWTLFAAGTNLPVNIRVMDDGVRARFFRLKGG